MLIDKMKMNRAKIERRMRELKSAAKNRGFTATEKKRYEAMRKECAALADLIRAAETKAKKEGPPKRPGRYAHTTSITLQLSDQTVEDLDSTMGSCADSNNGGWVRRMMARKLLEEAVATYVDYVEAHGRSPDVISFDISNRERSRDYEREKIFEAREVLLEQLAARAPGDSDTSDAELMEIPGLEDFDFEVSAAPISGDLALRMAKKSGGKVLIFTAASREELRRKMCDHLARDDRFRAELASWANE